jgi:hypothetical protein
MLSKSHGKKSAKERKAKRTPASNGSFPTLTESYNKSDNLVGLVYADIANGVSRSDVIEKIKLGAYEGMERGYAARTAAYYYNAALDRFAVDTDIEAEKLRKMFYGRYEAILEQCIKNGDMYNARATLDSMAKIFGIEKKTPDTAIMINSDKENGVTVNFGFSDKNDEN